MAASSSLVTCFMRMRLEWKVKRSGARASRARRMAGISVSIVVLELGTICPMRKWVLAVMSIHRDVVGLDHLAPVVRLALDRSEEHTSELQSHLNLVCRLLLE